MKLVYSVLLTLLIISFGQAQKRDLPDVIETTQGSISIQPIIHGTVVVEWRDITIYIDPYGGEERFEGLNKPDIVLITDIHGDHLNEKTLNGLDLTGAQLFVPKAVKDKLSPSIQTKASVIGNGEDINYLNINIAAVPMYNLPNDETARHPKGRGNGYILTIGEERIYFSGDTEDIPEMRELKDIDVAFVCMNLPYTMDINQAASAVLDFKPTVVYPYHYRGSGGLSDVDAFKKLVVSGNKDIEVRLKNWYLTD